MITYEYETEQWSQTVNGSELNRKLNDRSRKGWELLTVTMLVSTHEFEYPKIQYIFRKKVTDMARFRKSIL